MNIVKWYKNRSFQFKLVIGYLVLADSNAVCYLVQLWKNKERASY